MKILVVEDDRGLRDVLTRALTESGHIVDASGDGVEGGSLGTDPSYDAIVLDVMLPGQDGFSIVRSLRKQDIRTPVIFLTARDAEEDAIAGLDAGAEDYLRKPFGLNELEARLRSITRRGRGTRSPDLCVSDVTFDPAKRRAWRAGIELPLTARELAFLEYFMRNAGLLATRDMIVSALWGCDADIASNVVDVYVRRLRAKLEPAGTVPLLYTIRGLGYRFGEER
jgi:DNA-binding response OmpR family regulator